MPLILLLVECGIEIIPQKIRANPKVRRSLRPRNYASQLLDTALHHSAMKDLNNNEKRGRPDILHVSLLNALDSPLNKAAKLRIIIHTTRNKIFEFNPEIRITRNYNRFKGLMSKLLIDGEIKTGENKLIFSIKENLKGIIDSIENSEVLLFSKRGKMIENYKTLFTKDTKANYIVIIGGFQKSSFSPQIESITDNVISISKYSLTANSVLNKVIAMYELANDVY